MHKNYLAIDIGASSGRHIVGWMENGVLRTEEVYRFPNSVQRVDGHLEWDIDSLFANVKQGIREAFAKYPNIESLSIDTWAVDYVLLKNDQPIYPVYTYRDSRTQAVIPEEMCIRDSSKPQTMRQLSPLSLISTMPML